MTTARILLAGLRRRGFVLAAADPSFAVLDVSPASRLTEADLTALRTHKEALLDLLWREQPPSPDTSPDGWRIEEQTRLDPLSIIWGIDPDTGEVVDITPISGRKIVVLAGASAGVPPVVTDPLPPPGPVPVPPGARLFWQTEKGKACPRWGLGPKAKRVLPVLWCWEGGPRWYPLATHPPADLIVSDEEPDESEVDD